MKYPLKRRLQARKTIALLTGSHSSLGLADRMTKWGGFKTLPGLQPYQPGGVEHKALTLADLRHYERALAEALKCDELRDELLAPTWDAEKSGGLVVDPKPPSRP